MRARQTIQPYNRRLADPRARRSPAAAMPRIPEPGVQQPVQTDDSATIGEQVATDTDHVPQPRPVAPNPQAERQRPEGDPEMLFRKRPTTFAAPAAADLRIGSLLDDPALRRAMGLDLPAPEPSKRVRSTERKRRLDMRRLLESA